MEEDYRSRVEVNINMI
jgi:chromosome segregation ATPase